MKHILFLGIKPFITELFKGPSYTMYEGCSEIIETLAVNKLIKTLQILLFVVR